MIKMLDPQKLSRDKDEKIREDIYLSRAEHTLSGKIRRLRERVKKGVKIDMAYLGKLSNDLKKVTHKRAGVMKEIRHMTTMQSQLKKELMRRRR